MQKNKETKKAFVNGGVNELYYTIKETPGLNAKHLKDKRTIEKWLKELKNNDKVIFKGATKTGGYFVK